MTTPILKTTTATKFATAAEAFATAAACTSRAGQSVLRVRETAGKKRATWFLVASTPWAYRLQQQGRGEIVLRDETKKCGFRLSAPRAVGSESAMRGLAKQA